MLIVSPVETGKDTYLRYTIQPGNSLFYVCYFGEDIDGSAKRWPEPVRYLESKISHELHGSKNLW